MAALLDRASQAVSVTRVSRAAKEIFGKLRKREQDRFVVMRNNQPAAVLLSVPAFEALMDELEDLRVEGLARERRRSLDRRKTISHAEMKRRYGVPAGR